MVSKTARGVKALSKKTGELDSNPGIHVIEGENFPQVVLQLHTDGDMHVSYLLPHG